MKNLDPYEELGVPRDASLRDVKGAYKRKAGQVHPDKNPAPDAAEKFHRVCTALAVLSNPARREKFDRTGTIDEEKPDNTRATALQLIEGFIEQKVAAYINGNFSPEMDPRRCDLVDEFTDQMNADITNAEIALISWAKAKRFLADMAKRWKGKKPNGPIERAFEARLHRADEQVRQLKEASECRRIAKVIIAEYEFEFDDASSSPLPREDKP